MYSVQVATCSNQNINVRELRLELAKEVELAGGTFHVIYQGAIQNPKESFGYEEAHLLIMNFNPEFVNRQKYVIEYTEAIFKSLNESVGKETVFLPIVCYLNVPYALKENNTKEEGQYSITLKNDDHTGRDIVLEVLGIFGYSEPEADAIISGIEREGEKTVYWTDKPADFDRARALLDIAGLGYEIGIPPKIWDKNAHRD